MPMANEKDEAWKYLEGQMLVTSHTARGCSLGASLLGQMETIIQDYVNRTHWHPVNPGEIRVFFDRSFLSYQSLLTPEREISIDESLMLYKGWLGWIQYTSLKRSRFGVKTFKL
ncbi:hypothetical protein J437_LFUL002875 [Ladona fulva]|uniref:Transposase n=1 Tax=Ladona fulva TaxID=123851 RepID=A0A8K0KQA9_LADFU|nr:hypothetical protein J437_LFUL002875 [Ladona fulva]